MDRQTSLFGIWWSTFFLHLQNLVHHYLIPELSLTTHLIMEKIADPTFNADYMLTLHTLLLHSKFSAGLKETLSSKNGNQAFLTVLQSFFQQKRK